MSKTNKELSDHDFKVTDDDNRQTDRICTKSDHILTPANPDNDGNAAAVAADEVNHDTDGDNDQKPLIKPKLNALAPVTLKWNTPNPPTSIYGLGGDGRFDRLSPPSYWCEVLSIQFLELKTNLNQ